MDVIDLWELLANVDDWSFETFPWDVFSLCHSTVEPCPDLLPKNADGQLESGSSAQEDDDHNNEIISFTNHVPPGEVPTHPQVVPSIHSKENNACEENNGYQIGNKTSREEESFEEGLLIVEPTEVADTKPPQTLEESMDRLQASLDDRSALSLFEKLSKKTNSTMDIAKLLENVPRNRYKDVLPYDDSRVILSGTLEESYINASFVRMELPPPRTANTYIATQGPLPNTCNEFWQMVFEQKCGLIVMVTTLKERNRVKCHQYWPDLYQESGYGQYQVTCFNETVSTAGITREFLVSTEQSSEERHVIQLQYITWPDHGVPEDSTDFLQFVQQLRDLRRLVGGPVVVHCSAGVGRTGVVILMETAIDFIEAAEPLDPLRMVRIMRDQRVMMVQTVIQFRFICEAILRTYKDHRVTITEND